MVSLRMKQRLWRKPAGKCNKRRVYWGGVKGFELDVNFGDYSLVLFGSYGEDQANVDYLFRKS